MAEKHPIGLTPETFSRDCLGSIDLDGCRNIESELFPTKTRTFDPTVTSRHFTEKTVNIESRISTVRKYITGRIIERGRSDVSQAVILPMAISLCRNDVH